MKLQEKSTDCESVKSGLDSWTYDSFSGTYFMLEECEMGVGKVLEHDEMR